MAIRWVLCLIFLINCKNEITLDVGADNLLAAEDRAESMMTFIQVREGYLQDMAESVQSMRVNAVIASDSKCSDEQRKTLALTFLHHLTKIQKIIKIARLNGLPLFDESDAGYQSQISFYLQAEGAPLALQLGGLNPEEPLGFKSKDGFRGEFAPNTMTAESAKITVDLLDQALKRISSERSRLGGWYNRLEYATKIMMGKLVSADLRSDIKSIEGDLSRIANTATQEILATEDRLELNVQFNLLLDEIKRTRLLCSS
jgi:flagellin-like hook-associated protein FlgL